MATHCRPGHRALEHNVAIVSLETIFLVLAVVPLLLVLSAVDALELEHARGGGVVQVSPLF